ncbi:MAG TPA: PadR family transcriptional regulator [Vicinamibacterales bacterium]|nr:PadR family transcriptional regulator [Vicinamibacterales bacterium]
MPFRSSESLLPLTPIAFEILLALAEEDRHGYAILQAVESRLRGKLPMRTGTLYRALARLVEDGLIEELDSPPGTDSRRRTYRITRHGRSVARAETERMSEQVAAARSRKLAPGFRH